MNILSNQANKGSGFNIEAVIDAGTTSHAVSCDVLTTVSEFVNFGIIGRSNSAGTVLFECQINAGSNIMRIVENGSTIRASQVITINTSITYALKVVFSGADMDFTVDGANSLPYGAANNGETNTGIVSAGAGTTDAYKWDNFEVTST